MTPAVQTAIRLGLTELLRQRERIEAEIAEVRAALGETAPEPEPAPTRTLPPLTPHGDSPPPAEELIRYLGASLGRVAFSGAHPRPEWTDAQGVTRRLYVGGDAQNAHTGLGVGIPQALGLRRGFWLTADEVDRMAQHKRDRAGRRSPAPKPPPGPADDWRKGRHMVRDAAMVRKAEDMGIGRVFGGVAWLTPMEDAQIRANLRAV